MLEAYESSSQQTADPRFGCILQSGRDVVRRRKATFVRACAKLANIFGDVRGQFCKVVWDLRSSAMVTQWFGKIQMLCFHRVSQRTVNGKKAQKQRCDTAIPTKKANIFSAMMAYPT